jgi:hypothetical protein
MAREPGVRHIHVMGVSETLSEPSFGVQKALAEAGLAEVVNEVRRHCNDEEAPRSASPAGLATLTTPPETAIAAATPPRTTRANWPSDRASVSEFVAHGGTGSGRPGSVLDELH